jgi:hypothetical protein
MMLAQIAQLMRRPGFKPTRAHHLDALGSVLAYVSGRWYETEYGVNGAGNWYKHAMLLVEARYEQLAREKETANAAD